MMAYRVGSSDEELTATGLSHYLEHLMFKGTEKLVPGDIDRMTQRAGGRNNAYTNEDFTNYHFQFAGDGWTTALEIEADRMRNLRIDAKHEFEQEKGAVIAELDRNEDQPFDLEIKALLPILFGKTDPYGHPVIGEKRKSAARTAEVIKGHYDRWYQPNNAVLVMAGGFDPDKAQARIRELFGPLQSQRICRTAKPQNSSERSATATDEIPSKFEVPRMIMGFNGVRMSDADNATLNVIQAILAGGSTTRLYKKLVDEEASCQRCRHRQLFGALSRLVRHPGRVVKGPIAGKAEETSRRRAEAIGDRTRAGRRTEASPARDGAGDRVQPRRRSRIGRQHRSCRHAESSLEDLKAELPRIMAVTPGGRASRREEILGSESARRRLVGSQSRGGGGASGDESGPAKRAPRDRRQAAAPSKSKQPSASSCRMA